MILGSSLTENAFFDPEETEKRIFNQTRRRTNFLRVAINYMGMELAERIDFFKYITKYPPDYLFIENFGLNFEFVDDRQIPVPIEVALLNLRNQIRGKIGAGTHENYFVKWYTFDSKPLPESGVYSDDFDSITFKALLPRRCEVRKVSQNKVANDAYNALMKMKTKVIFLDLSQSNKLLPYFLDNSKTFGEFNDVMEFYRQRYNIDYWQYPGVMDDSFFTDGIHLNYKGAAKYQEWFASQFASTK